MRLRVWHHSALLSSSRAHVNSQLLLTCSGEGWQKTVCTASGGKCLDSTSCKHRTEHTSHSSKSGKAYGCWHCCCA